MAEPSEVERILAQNYGQGFTSPALANYQADPANELGTQVTTPEVTGLLDRMYSGVPGMLRSGADMVRGAVQPWSRTYRTRTGIEHHRGAGAQDNMLAGGLDTAANWINGTPRIGEDTIAPLGLAALGMNFAVPGAVGIFGGRLFGRHSEVPNGVWRQSHAIPDPGTHPRWVSPTDADRTEFMRSMGWHGINYEPEASLNPNRASYQGSGQIAILDPSAARIVAPHEQLLPHEFRAYHGSNVRFDQIDPRLFQTFENSGDLIGSGFYATLNRADAAGIARSRVRALGTGRPHIMDVAIDHRRVPIARDNAFDNALQHWLNERYPDRQSWDRGSWPSYP